MNPFEQMELMRADFTKTDEKVYAKVVADVDAVMRSSATELAEAYDISQAALTRFCKKLGYQGFTDFKLAVYQSKKSAEMDTPPSSVAATYENLLAKVPAAFEQADTSAVVELLVNARLVVATGFHKSSLPAQLLAINLNQLQVLAQYTSYDWLTAGGYTFTSSDTLVIFSAESSVYRSLVDGLLERPEADRPRIVLVTMSGRHPLRNKVDQVVWLPSWKNQNLDYYAENQVVNMVFVDLLTAAVAHAIQA